MRGNNRKSIASIGELPQLTTMNVIDGQAGIVRYSSLIFYSLTIDNILNIIVLLILVAVSMATLTGENGILTKTIEAKKETEDAYEIEQIQLIILDDKIEENKIGQQLKQIIFSSIDDTTSIYDSQNGQTYEDGWYYITPEHVKTLNMDFKHSYIVNYETGEIVRFEEGKHRIIDNNLLCIKENLVYSVDAKNMGKGNNWGDAILHNFNFDDENSGWTENSLSFDGIDDGIEVEDKTDYSNGITIEMYFKYRGQTTEDQLVQILMMKRSKGGGNGFFVMLGNKKLPSYHLGNLYIDIGSKRLDTSYNVPINTPTYIQYTFDPNKEDEKGILYVNGEKKLTTNIGDFDGLIKVQNSTNIQIGCDVYSTLGGTDYTYPLNGEIYAARVYNRALTEAELTYNYENTVH